MTHLDAIADLQNAARECDMLPMWTVYDRPDDFPTQVVVRAHVVRGRPRRLEAEAVAYFYATVDEARAVLRRACLIPIPRQPSDHGAIVETWI